MRGLRYVILPALLVVACGTPPESEQAAPSPSDAATQRALKHVSTRGQELGVDRDEVLEVRDVILDSDGTEHVRMGRNLRGLPVRGADFVVHSEATGALRGFSGTPAEVKALARTPRITEFEAITLAKLEWKGILDSKPTAALLIDAANGAPALAWDVLFVGEGLTGPTEMHYLIDARSGELRDQWDGVETTAAAGTGKGFFNGNFTLTTDLVSGVYNLRDPSRGNNRTTDMNNGTSGNGTLFTDADNTWGTNALASRQTIAADAQYGTAVTWDYYKNVHGRNGIANNGTGAFNRVHYSTKYNNAFWQDSCFCMTYGDGDGTTFNPFDSLDVAGHEMTHGVTSRTAGLVYSGESGGLNEATSDIFGSMVEYYAANASDPGDFLIGEKLYKAGGGKALRYMYNPSLDGKSANCWSSSVGSLDVHYSSGVANHFFYLLSNGSAGSPASPTCNGSSVTGIGRDAAAKIWYRALTVYMTSSTKYAAARTASLNAAKDLYGTGSTQYNAVAAAWSAVSVN